MLWKKLPLFLIHPGKHIRRLDTGAEQQCIKNIKTDYTDASMLF
jgi:hypothetical protein